ncbi:MAG: DNA polymerase I [Phocaeicola sp.]
MEKLFLLDAYALIYRAYYAFIKSPRINSKGFNTSAVLGFVNTLEDVLKKENPTHIGVAFDPSGPTFRHEAYEAYKAQREETPEAIRLSVPIIKQIIRAYRIPILEVSGFEADDVIGTLATQAHQKGIKTYMMTPDKDYGQLVTENVFMYRPKYGDKEFEVLGIEEVKAKFSIESPLQVIDMLGLMGDSSDNIPGCPGVGEKTAQKLIAQFGSIEKLLENTHELKGALKTKVETNEEKIRFSKFLATIKIDVPIALELDQLVRETPNEAELRPIFEEMEFRNLSDRIFGKREEVTTPKSSTKKKASAPTLFDNQPSLFDQATDEKKSSSQASQADLFAGNGSNDLFSSNLNTLENLPYKYHLADNEREIELLIQNILTSKSFSLDTETTGTDPITAELVGMSFSYQANEAFYVPVPADSAEARKIVAYFDPLFQNEQIEKVGQNLKYDLIVLHKYGAQIKGPLFDTMVAHYVLQPELRHGMDYLAEIYLNYETIKIETLIGAKGKKQGSMRDLSPTEVYKYACEDADVTLKLKHILQHELETNQVTSLFYDVEMPLVPVLTYMEENGVRVDTEALKQTSELFTARMQQLENEVHELAGMAFNLSSPKQVGEVLFEKLKVSDKAKKTKTGQYSTGEEVLEGLRDKHPIVGKILQHRGLKKLLSTYIDALPLLIDEKSGNIHTSFNQTVTATGRLSSSNPNLQNIPIRNEDGKEIRKAFVPDEGCLFFSADYSQIELRIMAHLSEDAAMIEAFNSGDDIHAATAAKLYKIAVEEVTRDQRNKAKTANFGIIYGISVFGLADRMNVPRSEAKELIEGYFETYPRIKSYMDESIERAKEKGYIETLLGRKRYLPDIHSRNAVVRGYAERNAINAPIQGSAADIIKVAMVRIFQRFQAEGIKSKMVLQVHDELNFSVFPEEKEKVQQIVIEEMQAAYPMRVPLKADFDWGKNWLEAH